MFKLIVGIKGTGKTKTLVEMANAAAQSSNGSVVCIEPGDKLKFDVSHEVRLIDTLEYEIKDGQALYGFICGIVASNHDITDIFVDGSLKICRSDVNEMAVAVREIAYFIDSKGINCTMTASIAAEDLPENITQYTK